MFEKLRSSTRRLLGRGGQKTTHDREQWLNESQEGEFQWHLNDRKRRAPEQWMKRNGRLLDHFGFSPSQFAGKTVLDLGAGSRLRTKYFEGATIIAIEPLADRYRAEIPWCDLDDAAEVYSAPAEERIASCADRADLVLSVNVLDHCYDFATIIENVHTYVKSDGLVFFSFDKHEKADAMHPLELDEKICEEIFSRQGFRIERATQGTGGVLPANTYGHGPYCLNYALRK